MVKIGTPRMARWLTGLVALFVLLGGFVGVWQRPDVARAAAFTSGNLVVLRVGTGTGTLSNVSTAVFLDEFTTSGGAAVQSIALTSTGATAFTNSGSATSEGALARSTDGRYLTFAGYYTATGQASIAGTTAAAVNRVVARVDVSGNIDTSTRLNDASSGNNPRAAVTDDGTRLWLVGGTGAVRYTPFGTNGSSTQLATDLTNIRTVNIFDGQLYVSSSSGTFLGISKVGTGLPTTSGQTTTLFVNAGTGASSYGFAFFDLNGSVAGVDTAYVADDRTVASGGGIQKWTYNGTIWTLSTTFNNGLTAGMRGLTARLVGTSVELFGTTADNTLNKLVRVLDDGTASPAFTTLATAGTNTAFRGVAFAPENPTAPTITEEPQSQSIAFNSSATLTVTATGTAPLTYQWYEGNSGDETTPVGTNSNTFTTPNLTTNKNYWVKVSNSAGSDNSNTATITVGAAPTPPTITVQPQSQTVAPNVSVVLTVTATGTAPLSYQWYEGNSGDTSTPVGTNSNTFTTPPLTASKNYWVRVTNTAGNADSQTAVITVNAVPQIGPIPALSSAINDPTNFGVRFLVTDTETAAGTLTVTVQSTSNPAVAPLANITVTTFFAGSRNVYVEPAGVGYSDITLRVEDSGGLTATAVLKYAASAASSTPATTRFHYGKADASTAIPLDDNYMLVADDEDQVLRVYSRTVSGLPLAEFDFTSSLGLTQTSSGVPREVDIEASARVGNRIYWMGSHSRGSAGQDRPNRYRIFATDLNQFGTSLTYVGRYDTLRQEIINWDNSNGHGKGAGYYGLGTGSNIPEDPNLSGFNIEGLTFAPDNTTAYVAFRAPVITPTNNITAISRTHALIVPIANFASLFTLNPSMPMFEAPIELDLGGRGIREIRKNADNQYLIIAGSASSVRNFALYTWTGNRLDKPTLRTADLSQFNTDGSFESILDVPANLNEFSQIQLLVDNGDTVYYNDGVAAKDLPIANFKKFRSERVTLGNIVRQNITLTLTSAPNPSTLGQTVTFNASVTAFEATGTVTFTNGATILGTANLINGFASFQTNMLPAGSQVITATYGGDANYNTASDDVIQVVNKTASITNLSSAPNPSTLGQSVTFTATVTPITATGTVTFTRGATVLGTANLVSGVATFTTSSLPVGSSIITASYGGDANYDGSADDVTQVVNRADSQTSLVSAPNPSTFGQNVVFTATVTPITATGTITFATSPTGTVLATAPLVNGVATATISTLPVGTTAVRAEYGGDTNFNPSQSDVVNQIVNVPPVCDKYLVTLTTDNGAGTLCGTLSFALSNAITATEDVTITFSVSTIAVSGLLPVGGNNNGKIVALEGGCTVNSGRGAPGVALVGSGTITSGLRLSGKANVNGLSVTSFGGYGVEVSGSQNIVRCSWIGTRNGTTANANTGGGVLIKAGASGNMLGAAGVTSSGNVISGNGGAGVRVEGGLDNMAYYNYIGYAADGTTELRNADGGVRVVSGGQLKFGLGNRVRS
jgi:hypothetical protein